MSAPLFKLRVIGSTCHVIRSNPFSGRLFPAGEIETDCVMLVVVAEQRTKRYLVRLSGILGAEGQGFSHDGFEPLFRCAAGRL